MAARWASLPDHPLEPQVRVHQEQQGRPLRDAVRRVGGAAASSPAPALPVGRGGSPQRRQVETRIPCNRFLRLLYIKVLVVGILLLLTGIGGELILVALDGKGGFVPGLILKMLIVFIPVGLYYIWVGTVGAIKHHIRMEDDETGEPWWCVRAAPAIVGEGRPRLMPPWLDRPVEEDAADDPMLEIGGGEAGAGGGSRAAASRAQLHDAPELGSPLLPTAGGGERSDAL